MARSARFAGIAFRVASAADYEIVYFRGDGGRGAKVQYQPFFEGEPTWQLYPGPGYRTGLPVTVSPPSAPTHVTILFAGTRADDYLNHSAEPVLRVVELKRTVRAGHVGTCPAARGSKTTSAVARPRRRALITSRPRLLVAPTPFDPGPVCVVATARSVRVLARRFALSAELARFSNGES